MPRVTNYAYCSFDGGLTWKATAAPKPDGRVQGDDAIVFGRDGTAYHSYIAFDGIRVDRPERAWSGIFVRSTRDGLDVDDAGVAVVDHINTAIPFEDKPWLGVDRAAASPASRQRLRRLDAIRRVRQHQSHASQPHHALAIA